jgi:hypothetical protein
MLTIKHHPQRYAAFAAALAIAGGGLAVSSAHAPGGAPAPATGDDFQQLVTTSPSQEVYSGTQYLPLPVGGGSFTVTQSGVECGFNPKGDSDGNTLIDALDLDNSADPTTVVATPCP